MKARIELDEIKPLAQSFLEYLSPVCERIEIVGSIRRMKDFCGDIEILAIPKIRTSKKKAPLGDALGVETKVIRETNLLINFLKKKFERRKLFIIKGKDKYFQLVSKDLVQVDLFLANKDNWGLIKMIRTGSAAYSKNFMIESAKTKYESSKGYLRDRETGEIIPVESEEELFEIIGFPLLHPRERTALIFPKPQ